MKTWTHLDFTARTDVLARHLACDLGVVASLIGISRASLFAYRSGKSRITAKSWSKLEHAEREAGLKPPLREQLLAVTDEPTRTLLLESADMMELSEVVGRAPTRVLLTKQQLSWFEFFSECFFVQAMSLAEVASKAARAAKDKELAADLRHFSKVVRQDGETMENWVKVLISQLSPVPGAASESSPRSED